MMSIGLHVLQGILRMSTLPKFILDLMHFGNEDMIANPSTQCVGLAFGLHGKNTGYNKTMTV